MNPGEQMQQVVQQHGGMIGTGATGAGLATFVTAVEPLMKLITFGLTTTVAVLTIVWTWRRLRGTKAE